MIVNVLQHPAQALVAVFIVGLILLAVSAIRMGRK